MTPQQTAAPRFRNLLGQGFDGSTIGFAPQQFEFLLYPGKEAELLRQTQQDARLYTAVNCLFNEERRASDPHLLDRVPIPQPAMPGPKPPIKITRHAPKTGNGQDSRVFEGVPAASNSHANNPHPKIDPAQLDGHQLHFLVESQNNFELNGSQQAPAITGQYLDMIQVPFWDQNPAHPFPSVTLRIDFRGNDIGDFVFHCHILNHEDLGMMNIIRVQAP
jgi:hypothetical protein